jgi:RNA polymerase sigma-70 factor (ECF subfamily)
MAGTRTWFSGRETCLRYLMHVIGSPGDWQMEPTLANGQPAGIARYRDNAYGLGVLTVTPTGISRITVFGGGFDWAAKFGFPPIREGVAGF